MRIPKPRLRQVFEHTTSFKVKKPTGQTITIAKKGLSPSTIGRLRRFAQGGEVQNYQVGGEVPDADDAAFADEEARMQESRRLIDAAIERTKTQPAAAEPAPAVEEQPAPMPQRKVVTVAANETAQTAPAPAPVQVVVNAPQPAPAAPAVPQAAMTPVQPAPAPVAASQRLEAAPKTEAAAEKAPAQPAKEGELGFVGPPKPKPGVPIVEAPLPAAPVAEEVVPPVTVQRTTPLVPVPAYVPPPPEVIRPWDLPVSAMGEPRPYVPQPTVPVGQFLSRPGLLVPSLAAPAGTPTDMAAPAAAPAPVAPVAVAPSRPITAQAIRDEAKKTPNATVADLVTRIAGVDAAIDPIVMQGAAAIPAVDMLKTGKLADAYVAGVAQELDAAKLEADARVEQARIEQEALNAERLRAAEKAKADIERAEALRTHSKQLEQEAMASDNLKSFFDSQGTAYSVLSLVSLAIGGFLSGYTNTPNYVLRAFNDAMDKDLEEQKRRRTSKWNRYKEVLGDADAADLLVRADNDQLASIAIKKASLQQNVAKIRPELERLQAQLQQRAALNMAALDLKLAQAEDKREPPPPRVVRGGAGAPKPSPATEFKLKKWETGRTFGIGDIPVKAPSDTGMTGVRINLANRNQAVAALDKAVDALDSLKPGETINVLSPERQKALSEVALQIETFPLAFGFQRAVSKVAKEQLKEAIANPFGIAAILKQITGNVDPATGMKLLRDETVSAREKFVKGQAQADSRREQDAAEYGLWKQRSKELAKYKIPAPPKPKLSFAEADLERLPDEPAPAAAPTPTPAPGGAKKFTYLKPLP